MKKSHILLSLLFTASLAGCLPTGSNDEEINALKQEIETIKQNLGPLRHVALSPDLAIEIKSYEFMEPESEYGSPRINIKAHLKQQNKDFPENKYKVIIRIVVLDGNKKEVGGFFLNTDVEDGVSSIAEIVTVYSLPKEFTGFTLMPEFYNWHVEFAFKFKEIKE